MKRKIFDIRRGVSKVYKRMYCKSLGSPFKSDFSDEFEPNVAYISDVKITKGRPGRPIPCTVVVMGRINIKLNYQSRDTN